MAFIAAPFAALAGGGFFGNLALAAISIGANLAIAYFFPQKVKGPRAENLKAQTSRYGDQIARVYGTVRTAGAVIWLKGNQVDEHARTYRQGKALGPEVTEYTYTATFAVALAYNGPMAAVTKLWADDKLVYDQSSASLENAIENGGEAIGVAAGATVTVYLGTDTQLSNAAMEAALGAGNVPAYPKLCYVVIENFPLDEFGIRVPNIEAEVVHIPGDGEYLVTELPTSYPNPYTSGDDINGKYVVQAEKRDVGMVTAGINFERSVLPGGESVETYDELALSTTNPSVHIDDRDQIIGAARGYFTVFDAATMAFKYRVTRNEFWSAIFHQSAMDDVSVAGVTYLLSYTFSADDGIFSLLADDGNGYTLLWEETSTIMPGNDIGSGCGGGSIGPQYGYFIPIDDLTAIVRVDIEIAGLAETLVTPPGLTDDITYCHYEENSDSVIIICANGDIFVYSPDLSTLLSSKTGNGFAVGAANSTRILVSKRLMVGPDRFAIYGDDLDIHIFALSTLEEVLTIASSLYPNMTGMDWLGNNDRYAAMLFGEANVDRQVIYLPRVAKGVEPLADVIDAECRSVGLIPDVSELTDDVRGYGVRDGSAPRGVIEDLQRNHFVDWAQVDGVITFFPRKTAAEGTITVAETGMALNGEPNPVEVNEEYPSPIDVPEQVIIQYISDDAMYRTGTQAGNPEEDQPFPDEPSEADETGFPVKVRRKRHMQFSTNEVLGDNQAAQIADLIHNELRDASSVYRTKLGPKYLTAHPGLVYNLPLDESRVAKAVITKMTGDMVLDMEFRKRGDSYESVAVGVPTPYVEDTILGIATATPVLIDGHLLRSVDDSDGFYAGIAPTSSGQFRGGTLFQSEDSGATYSPWASFSNGTIRGLAVTALENRPHPDSIDRASSFIIAISKGSPPDSISEEALLASETSNAFAVYNQSLGEWEYIRAATVVDNGDKTWTLSTLLRGRQGTEFAMVGHAVGDAVVHLDANAIARTTDGDRTLARKYVAVPVSTAFDSTGAVNFTNMGKGLRPWSPTHLYLIRDGSGNITGRFFRRDRLGQQWPESGAEDPPLSEDSEDYEVLVYNVAGSSVLRTITVSDEAFTYSAADQTTDFGGVQDRINFGIRQLADVYGDGIEYREAA